MEYDELLGVWCFNEQQIQMICYAGSSWLNEYVLNSNELPPNAVRFCSCGGEYSGFIFPNEYDPLPEYNSTFLVACWDNRHSPIWTQDDLRTITITDTSTLTNREEFTAWLKMNAAKMDSSEITGGAGVHITNGTIVNAPYELWRAEQFYVTVDADPGYELTLDGVLVRNATLASIGLDLPKRWEAPNYPWDGLPDGNAPWKDDDPRGKTRYVLYITENTGYAMVEITMTPKANPVTTISYDGETLATLSQGQTATIGCAGKIMKTDVVIAFLGGEQ